MNHWKTSLLLLLSLWFCLQNKQINLASKAAMLLVYWGSWASPKSYVLLVIYGKCLRLVSSVSPDPQVGPNDHIWLMYDGVGVKHQHIRCIPLSIFIWGAVMMLCNWIWNLLKYEPVVRRIVIWLDWSSLITEDINGSSQRALIFKQEDSNNPLLNF